MENTKLSWQELFKKYNLLQSSIINNNSLDNILFIISKLKEEYTKYQLNITIFPKEEDIFKCFNYFEFNQTKVVILGQDPYHSPNQATGLCFGVNNIPPPSLKNITKELKNDLDIKLTDFTLVNWAKQGILLLNASLSVIQGKPTSQMAIWSEFTKYIIEELNKAEFPIIFVAWGAFAYEKLKNIDTNKHRLIVSSHPSPLSVTKKFKQFHSFSGSKPFSQINQILSFRNEEIINW